MRFKNILGKGEKAEIESIESDFVSLASHQLRTPLSAVKWYVEILLKDKENTLTRKQREHLAEIYRSNERAINLVNDLLDVSRIQEGHIQLEYRPTRVEDVVEEIISNFETLLKTNKVSVDFEIINGPLPKIETDAEKLKRVLSNLLSNAIKYTPPQGKITVIVEKKPREIKISVTDSGLGIATSDQPKIFRKFFRSSKAIKFTPDGTGLGLFIAKSLIETMGGKIGFASAEGKGTTFYFSLPIK